MNYTKNYRLPQWVKEDRIMMDDFNAMNTSIESGLTKTAATANAARADASEAKQAADAASAKADVLPYVVGYYTGTGNDMTIELGFRPAFVIISGAAPSASVGSESLGYYNLISGGRSLVRCITFTDTGFTLHKLENNQYPRLVEGRLYDYIAFR